MATQIAAHQLDLEQLLSVYERQHPGWTLRVMACGHLQARRQLEVASGADDADWSCQVCHAALGANIQAALAAEKRR